MGRLRSGHRTVSRVTTPVDRLLMSPAPRYGGCDFSATTEDWSTSSRTASKDVAHTSASATAANNPRHSVAVAPHACRIHVVDYGQESVNEHGPLRSLAQFAVNDERAAPARWVSVEGACADEVERVRRLLQVPALPCDAALHAGIAPRLEVFDAGQVLFVCHAPLPGDADGGEERKFGQVAFFVDVAQNLIVTLHGPGDDGADEFRARIMSLVHGNTDDMRRHSVVHLLCLAIVVLVDRFYPALEHEGDELDEVEALLLGDADLGAGKDLVKRIAGTKRSMLALRRRVWPFRKCLTRLSLVPFPNCDSRFYFRDVLDHVIQILDVLEVHRDAAHSLLDIYLGAQNNRMQEIMQKIAVVTTIFVPLTFLTSVEGMNFQNMPELSGKYSYLGFLCIVAGLVVSMITWFRRRGWM